MPEMILRLMGLGLLMVTSQMPVRALAQSHAYQAGPIRVVQPWMRTPPAASKVAGGFMTLTNTGTETDRLVAGTLADAGRFEVHEMSVAGGVMRMRQLGSGLEIKPGETVVLKPGSYHVMFLDLLRSPQAGTRLKGTLVFEKAGTVEIEYKVEPAGVRSSGDHVQGSGKGSGSGSGSGAANNANQ
jgi:periplasmic copper chaperone A